MCFMPLKKILKIIVIFVVLFWGETQIAYAQNLLSDDPQKGTSMSNEEIVIENDVFLFSEEADPFTGLVYTHSHPNADNGFVYGIDVSYYNGSIDWEAVKRSGIQNVMVRVGYRGYGSEGTLNEDPKFRENIEGALEAGLDVGVYIFSQAITQQEASDEADFVIDRIREYNITLPVVIDFEFASTASGTGGRLYDANLSVDKATKVCKAFCRIVKEEGYTAMVYANKSMLTDHLNAADISDQYMVWLANYTTNTTYTGRYDVWQYSSSGRVDGISGYVDCNFWYQQSDTVYDGVDYAAVYDYEYYVSKYSDVKRAFGNNKQKVLAHFVNYGMREGRQGIGNFNVYTYKNRYADLRRAYGNELKKYYLHYVNHGMREGRDGSGTSSLKGAVTVYEGIDYAAVYNYEYYINRYSDIKNTYKDDDGKVLRHFVLHGMAEGRRGNEEFDVNFYRGEYNDLKNKYGDNLKDYYLHYIKYGKAEGRKGNSDGSESQLEGTAVYEGVDYSSVYDYEYYINKYPDVRRAYGSDKVKTLRHFVLYGMKEGRRGNEEFDVYYYQGRYKDLQKAYGDDLVKYYQHFIRTGKEEGRIGSEEKQLEQAEMLMDSEALDEQVVFEELEEIKEETEDITNSTINEDSTIPEILEDDTDKADGQQTDNSDSTILDEPENDGEENIDETGQNVVEGSEIVDVEEVIEEKETEEEDLDTDVSEGEIEIVDSDTEAEKDDM